MATTNKETKMDDVEPGHFRRSFLQGLDKKDLEGLKERLESELKDEPYARRHAIMNLIGVVTCLLDNIAGGIEMFEKVKGEDPKNLNALKNIQWLYKQRGLKKKENETAERIAQTLRDCSLDEGNVLKGRALIEIARASCLTDQHHLQAENDIEFGKRIFECGLALGKDNPDKDEFMDWKFGYAFHLLRMAKKVRNIDKDNVKYFKLAVQEFYDIATYSDDNVQGRGLHRQESGDAYQSNEFAQVTHTRNDQRVKDMSGKAWVFAGVLLNWYKQFDTLSSVVSNCKEAHKEFNGFRCLEKAKETAPRCGAVLRRVAQEYNEFGDSEKAHEIAVLAVKVQPIGFAYYVLGQVFLKEYRKKRQMNQNDVSTAGLLDSAIKNLKEAYDKHFKPSYAVKDLAIAYRLKGDLNSALQSFINAEKATGGVKDHRMYDEWAKCLDEMEENNGAVEKRSRAVEIRKNEPC